jgi:hypothetical protein
VAVIAIVLPIFNYAPKLYLWFIRECVRRLYRRLRVVEQELQTELSSSQVQVLQSGLESIARAAAILPKRNSDLFSDFNRHIEATRARLASRLVEARSPPAKVA